MSAPTTLAAALREAQARGLPRLEAQMLVLLAVTRAAHDRAWLMAHDTDVLTAPQQAHLAGLVTRRLAGEPMAYLTGRHEFYGLDLAVDARVLDPRDDTETLVDWGLEVIAPLPHPRPGHRQRCHRTGRGQPASRCRGERCGRQCRGAGRGPRQCP